MSTGEKPFIILGGGGHAKVVASMLRQLGKSVLGYTDPNPKTILDGQTEYLGTDDILATYDSDDVHYVIGLGSIGPVDARRRLFMEQQDRGASQQDRGASFPALVHPFATVAPEATLGAGSQVMAGAVVQAGATIQQNVLVNTGATVDHDCTVGAHTHIAPGCTLSGSVTVEEKVHIGTGATIIQGCAIGKRSVVGAGAVVLEDVEADVTVVGVPAHPIS